MEEDIYGPLDAADNKVVGLKQVIRLVDVGGAERIYMAKDADAHIAAIIQKAAKEGKVPLSRVDSKVELGRRCGIKVSAACAAIPKAH